MQHFENRTFRILTFSESTISTYNFMKVQLFFKFDILNLQHFEFHNFENPIFPKFDIFRIKHFESQHFDNQSFRISTFCKSNFSETTLCSGRPQYLQLFHTAVYAASSCHRIRSSSLPQYPQRPHATESAARICHSTRSIICK